MYFKSLSINNFRGIKKITLKDLRNINLIVGENNSSKTSVLEAIFLLIGISNPELIIRIHQFRDIIFDDENDLSFIFYKFDYKNFPTIIGDTDKDSFRELIISPRFKDSKKDKLNKLSPLDNKSSSISFDTSHSEEHLAELKFEFHIKEFHKQMRKYNSKLVLDNRNLSIITDKVYSEKLKGVYVTPKIDFSTNLRKRLEYILINKKEKEIIDILKIIDPKIQGISFGSNKMIYFDISGINKLVPINLAGDGVRRLTAIALAMYDAKDGILLVDEIENGFHYSALKKLWKTILRVSKELNIQMFITTHNLETLKYLNKAVSESEDDSDSNIVRSYTLVRMKDDVIKSYKYDFDKFSYSINQDIEIR